jgi:S1-C subfamily serine protease
MPRLIGACFAALVAVLVAVAGAKAGDGMFDTFDPAPLNDSERRLLQTALAAAGDYQGPLDGVWGAGSQAALDAWTARELGGRPENAHVAALVLGLLEEVSLNGWDFRPLDGYGVSLALPFALLGPPEPEEGGERRWSRAGSLTVLTHRFDAAQTRAWHDAAVHADAGGAPGARRRAAELLITAGALRDGRRFFTRSDRTAAGWATVYLAAGPDEAAAMNLVAASIRPGPPLPWELPADGRLTRLVDAAAAFVALPDASPAALLPAPEAGALPVEAEPASTGTGFYLGPRTLVTAAHVVAPCGRIALADGSPLDLVAADPELDVAVLAAPRPAPAWLALADGSAARLGQRVHAAGFPYYAIAGTSLHLTTGNVSALAGVDDDPRFFSFSAPVQPGNSGGPLIDAKGRVLGLVVARLSEDFIVEATGTLPQNVNYALAEGELAAFLSEAGVIAAPGGLGRYALDEGAPDGFEAAVVPVLCK